MKDIINRLFKLLIYNSNPFFFKILNNIRFKLKKYNLKIKFSTKKGVKYEVVDNGLTRYYNIERQAYLSFHNGFKYRALDLGQKIYLLDNVKFKTNDIVIDVGSNTGDLYLYFQLIINKDVKYFAVEPGLKEFNCLKKNIPNNPPDQQAFNFALGNKNKTTRFYYKPKNGDSSIVKMRGYEDHYDVEEKTFDKFLSDLGLENQKIKLIKLEAEGYEPEIIFGLKKYLKNINYISADLGFERGIKEETTSPSVLNYLMKNNFEIVNQSKKRNVFLLKNLV